MGDDDPVVKVRPVQCFCSRSPNFGGGGSNTVTLAGSRQELDVFLNHALADSTYLVQLPLQNVQAPTGLAQATVRCVLRSQ